MLSCRVWRRRCFCSVVGFGGGRWVGAVPGLGDEAATRVGRSAGRTAAGGPAGGGPTRPERRCRAARRPQAGPPGRALPPGRRHGRTPRVPARRRRHPHPPSRAKRSPDREHAEKPPYHHVRGSHGPCRATPPVQGVGGPAPSCPTCLPYALRLPHHPSPVCSPGEDFLRSGSGRRPARPAEAGSPNLGRCAAAPVRRAPVVRG